MPNPAYITALGVAAVLCTAGIARAEVAYPISYGTPIKYAFRGEWQLPPAENSITVLTFKMQLLVRPVPNVSGKATPALIVTTAAVSVTVLKDGKPQEDGQGPGLKSFFENIPLTIPLTQDGALDLPALKAPKLDEYQQALVDCLVPLLPAAPLKKGESVAANSGTPEGTFTERSSGAAATNTLLEDEFTVGKVMDPAPVGVDANDKVLKFVSVGANAVAMRTQVNYYDVPRRQVVRSVIHAWQQTPALDLNSNTPHQATKTYTCQME